MESLPVSFVEKVRRVFGNSGSKWLSELPRIVHACRKKWNLSPGTMSPEMSMNYIEFCIDENNNAVAMKIGVPHKEMYTEMAALSIYAGQGAVELLDADRELGAMLLRHIKPGTMLRDVKNNKDQTITAAKVMLGLCPKVPENNEFPKITDWVKRAFRLTREKWDPLELMPSDLLDKAETSLDLIEKNGGSDVVLHGDLHHENILLDERNGWIAIDPKGAIGPRCYEPGRFIHNQISSATSHAEIEKMVADRLEIFSNVLDERHDLIAAGALVDCVLSRCWYFEEEGDPSARPDWHEGIAFARLLCRWCEL